MPDGLRLAVAAVTKRPVVAERLTGRELLVPAPTRSVVVFLGDRAAVALETKRPVRELRLTDLDLDIAVFSLMRIPRWRAASSLRPTDSVTITGTTANGHRWS